MTGLPPGFLPNDGKMPDKAKGKRVRVILQSGIEPKYDGGSTSPPGWAADGKGGCRWQLDRGEFSIKGYKIL